MPEIVDVLPAHTRRHYLNARSVRSEKERKEHGAKRQQLNGDAAQRGMLRSSWFMQQATELQMGFIDALAYGHVEEALATCRLYDVELTPQMCAAFEEATKAFLESQYGNLIQNQGAGVSDFRMPPSAVLQIAEMKRNRRFGVMPKISIMIETARVEAARKRAMPNENAPAIASMGDEEMGQRFDISLKEILVIIAGTALALGSFALEDSWVVIPMLSLSGLAFVGLCIGHKGNRIPRMIVSIVVICLLTFVGWRDLRHTSRPSPPIVAPAPPPTINQTATDQPGGSGGSNNVQGVQGNVTIVQNFGASKPASGLSTSRAGSAPRAWVAIEGLDASMPLTFNPSGGASAQVRFLLRDNGNAPATDVDVRGSLFAISFMGLTRQQMKDSESAYCDRFRTQQDQAIKFSLYAGRPVTRTLDVGLNQIYLDEAINKSEHGLFPAIGEGVIPVALILCVDYRSTSAKEHHQSQYAMQFVIPGDRVGNSNSYKSFLFGFEPQGSHPNAHLLGMDETID